MNLQTWGFPGLIGIAARLELPLPHVSNVPMQAGRRFQPTSTYTPGLMSSAIVSLWHRGSQRCPHGCLPPAQVVSLIAVPGLPRLHVAEVSDD